MTGKEKDDGPGLRVKVERMTERGTTVYSCPVCGRELFSVDGILIGVKDFDTCPNCGLKIWWMDAIGDGLSWAEEIGANETGRLAQIYALKGGKAEMPWPGEKYTGRWEAEKWNIRHARLSGFRLKNGFRISMSGYL